MGFKKGNPGKPKGAISARIKAWKALGDTIAGIQADLFKETVTDLMSSEDMKERVSGCELYIKALEYFKPKQARITHTGEKESPINIIIAKNL